MVQTTNIKHKTMEQNVYNAHRRKERISEHVTGEGGFFELVELFTEKGTVIAKSTRHHPEGMIIFNHDGVEYFSLNMRTPVYHRIL